MNPLSLFIAYIQSADSNRGWSPENQLKSTINSTSQSTLLGSCFTATQERAGFPVKYFAYTSLNTAKSLISARKQVVFTTFANVTF